MIIFRYLAKEILASMLGVSLVLLLIFISARFVSYLAEAAAGQLDAGVLLLLMAFRLPEYLELILPLGLFIGIIMSFGRLHAESEMTVMTASGISELRLLRYTMITSALVAFVVAVFSFFLGPEGVRASQSLLTEQRNRTDFETLKPARFHVLNSGRGVSYASAISADKQRLTNVFLAELASKDTKTVPTILMARSGETIIESDQGQKYLLLKNGKRYVGQPGSGNYEVVEFEEYAQRLPEPDYSVRSRNHTDGMRTQELFNDVTPQAKAALEWRFSLPVLVFIVGFMAVPLSRTKPRKGRYGKLIPAILIYMVYLVSANGARGVSESGTTLLVSPIWLVHLGFFALASLLFFWPAIRRSLSHRRKIKRGLA